ncbi:hypothetical protein F4780DRAFT_781024 [Xylariomycetidae sp. FL0641]|nr:hypothetical protein F4780DRAFT_781024 [Xylariomycetidae sp. FL0641]
MDMTTYRESKANPSRCNTDSVYDDARALKPKLVQMTDSDKERVRDFMKQNRCGIVRVPEMSDSDWTAYTMCVHMVKQWDVKNSSWSYYRNNGENLHQAWHYERPVVLVAPRKLKAPVEHEPPVTPQPGEVLYSLARNFKEEVRRFEWLDKIRREQLLSEPKSSLNEELESLEKVPDRPQRTFVVAGLDTVWSSPEVAEQAKRFVNILEKLILRDGEGTVFIFTNKSPDKDLKWEVLDLSGSQMGCGPGSQAL